MQTGREGAPGRQQEDILGPKCSQAWLDGELELLKGDQVLEQELDGFSLKQFKSWNIFIYC